jgi:hypothetical protein
MCDSNNSSICRYGVRNISISAFRRFPVLMVVWPLLHLVIYCLTLNMWIETPTLFTAAGGVGRHWCGDYGGKRWAGVIQAGYRVASLMYSSSGCTLIALAVLGHTYAHNTNIQYSPLLLYHDTVLNWSLWTYVPHTYCTNIVDIEVCTLPAEKSVTP